jgi:hypothetical protein
MDEHVLAAVIRLNEGIALRFVVPLYCGSIWTACLFWSIIELPTRALAECCATAIECSCLNSWREGGMPLKSYGVLKG